MAKGKTGNTRFKKPIKMDLGDNPGRVRFANVQELRVWADAEISWSIFCIRNKSFHGAFGEIYEQHEAPSESLAAIAQSIIDGYVSADAKVDEIKHHLAAFREHKAIHSDSQYGQLINTLDDGQIIIGALAAMLAYPLGKLFARQIDSRPMILFLIGYTIVQSTFPLLEDAGAAATRARLNRLLSNGQYEARNREAGYKAFLQESSRALNKVQNEASEALEKLQGEASSHAAEMLAIKTLYEEFMKLDSPARYWRKRARNSLMFAWCGVVVFVLIAIGGLFGVYWGYPRLLSEFRSDDGSLGAGVIGLITVPAAIVLMAMALVFRSITSWFRDASMASERHTIIMTYIALAGDGSIGEHHRDRLVDRTLTPTSEKNSAPDQAGPYLGVARTFDQVAKPDGE